MAEAKQLTVGGDVVRVGLGGTFIPQTITPWGDSELLFWDLLIRRKTKCVWSCPECGVFYESDEKVEVYEKQVLPHQYDPEASA